jgi:hypothetical protein
VNPEHHTVFDDTVLRVVVAELSLDTSPPATVAAAVQVAWSLLVTQRNRHALIELQLVEALVTLLASLNDVDRAAARLGLPMVRARASLPCPPTPIKHKWVSLELDRERERERERGLGCTLDPPSACGSPPSAASPCSPWTTVSHCVSLTVSPTASLTASRPTQCMRLRHAAVGCLSVLAVDPAARLRLFAREADAASLLTLANLPHLLPGRDKHPRKSATPTSHHPAAR